MLQVKNLSVSIHDKPILDDLNLRVEAGKVAAIMGPNGSGKSTLSYVIAGKPDYEVTGGEVLLNGENLLALAPDARAAKGVFLAFQYPVEIPGVATMTFLKASLNAQRRTRGESDLTTPDFMRAVRGAASQLKVDPEMLKRAVNVGFSGGEKKRVEILQMALLQPRLCVLDETDSGLDIDALRIVAEGVNALRDAGRAFLIITHYQRLLDYIKPDVVHVMARGRIVKSGGPELALELERDGYREYAGGGVSSLRAIEKTGAEAVFADAFHSGPRSPEASAAFARFAATGLPSRRMESWHYTDLRRALGEPAPFAPQPDSRRIAEVKAELAKAPRLATTRLVLVDGRFAPELSDPVPEGASMRGGAPALALNEREDPMLAFAGAFAQGGFSFEVQDGADVGRVEIVHALRPGVSSASHLRFYFLPEAKGVIVERTLGAGEGAQRHRLASFELSASAKVEHVAIVEDDSAVEIESLRVALQQGAAFSSFGFIAGGALTRRQIFARLDGPHAAVAISGLSLIDGARHADTTLEVAHAAPHGASREFFRHIVADSGVGVYQGKVIVAPHAQKTDGAMKSQALLLSPTAQMNNKPELEIFADDVVCGHGATVGALDPEQTFYLQSRGVPKAEAEAMLLEAFGVEAIERVADEAIADALRERLRLWLKGRAK